MDDRPKRKRRPTPPLSTKWLHRQAVTYIERYQGSEKRIRQILWKRVRRAQSFHGGEDAEASSMIHEVIAQLRAEGRIHDTRFATDWAISLQNRGSSSRMIRSKLQQKGLGQQAIEEALHVLSQSGEAWEEEAAMAYARRRRLGPFRVPYDDSWERRQKDLASMARAGFGFGLAKKILSTPSRDAD